MPKRKKVLLELNLEEAVFKRLSTLKTLSLSVSKRDGSQVIFDEPVKIHSAEDIIEKNPNDILKQLRDALAGGDKTADRAASLVTELDDYLTAGGKLPDDWG